MTDEPEDRPKRAIKPPPPTPVRHPLLTPAKWARIVVLWESGSVTQSDLAKEFGVGPATIAAGLRKRKAIKGRNAAEYAKVTEEALKTEAQRRAEGIRIFREEYHKYIDIGTNAAASELEKLLSIPEDERTKTDIQLIWQALKIYTEVIVKMRDAKFHIYDIYKSKEEDKELPEIAVAEYTPDEIEEIKAANTIPALTEDEDDVPETARVLSEMDDE